MFLFVDREQYLKKCLWPAVSDKYGMSGCSCSELVLYHPMCLCLSVSLCVCVITKVYVYMYLCMLMCLCKCQLVVGSRCSCELVLGISMTQQQYPHTVATVADTVAIAATSLPPTT